MLSLILALSGWKQVIGTVLLAGAKVIPEPGISEAVEVIAWAFLGVGAVDRVRKNVTDEE